MSSVKTTLAHSLNSRGEFSSFVDPSSCSCRTCTSFMAPLSQEGLQSASSAPSPLPSGPGTGAGAPQDWMEMQPSVVERASLPPPPRAILRSAAFIPEEEAALQEQEVLQRLAGLRAIYLVCQDRVYEDQAASHDEMAMADQEWSELDEKIAAIESLLSRFRYPFRTR